MQIGLRPRDVIAWTKAQQRALQVVEKPQESTENTREHAAAASTRTHAPISILTHAHAHNHTRTHNHQLKTHTDAHTQADPHTNTHAHSHTQALTKQRLSRRLYNKPMLFRIKPWVLEGSASVWVLLPFFVETSQYTHAQALAPVS